MAPHLGQGLHLAVEDPVDAVDDRERRASAAPQWRSPTWPSPRPPRCSRTPACRRSPRRWIAHPSISLLRMISLPKRRLRPCTLRQVTSRSPTPAMEVNVSGWVAPSARPSTWISLRPAARRRDSVLSPKCSEDSFRASSIPKARATTFFSAALICTPRTSREEKTTRLPPERSSRTLMELRPLREALIETGDLPLRHLDGVAGSRDIDELSPVHPRQVVLHGLGDEADPGLGLDESLGEDGNDRPPFADVDAPEDLLDVGKQVERRDGDEEVLAVCPRPRGCPWRRGGGAAASRPGGTARWWARVDLRGHLLLEAPDVDGQPFLRQHLADCGSPCAGTEDGDCADPCFPT